MSKEIDLAVIGNLAFQKDHLPDGTIHKTQSGSGYYVTAGASLVSQKVGLVAHVGDDFDLNPLKQWGVDLSGINVVEGGETARFINIQFPDGTRQFSAETGVAGVVNPEIFPTSYLLARFIHLATNHPGEQLVWIDNLKTRVAKTTVISADIFESYVRQYPDLTKEVLKKAGMVFANEEEWQTLNQFGEIRLTVPFILKKGPLGAVYIEGDKSIEVPAPKVKAVDTSGAGEVLAGVFLSLRAQGVPVEQALEKAVHLASRSVTQAGIEHLHE